MQLRHGGAERLIALACALALATPVPAAAVPVPITPQIEAKQAEATAAQDQLDELQAQLELRAEEFAAITDELQQTRNDIERTREQLALADADLVAATGTLERRAAGIYRTGNVGILEVLLGTTSFADFLTRMDLLKRVNQSDATLVSTVKDAREEVRLAEQSLERREADQIVLRQRAEVSKQQVETALADQARYVTGLNAEVSKLIDQERKHQEELAAERARQAAAAAAAASSNTQGAPASAVGELGPGHPEAVTVALPFVGKVNYLWGGTTPLGFDCSGLTQYCYRQLGITIPRTSRSQFRSGSHIPPDRIDLLTPGDLVFFGYGGDPNRVHHVGIYSGDGNYVHAPGTGEKVTIASLTDRIASKGDYVGASRF